MGRRELHAEHKRERKRAAELQEHLENEARPCAHVQDGERLAQLDAFLVNGSLRFDLWCDLLGAVPRSDACERGKGGA